LQEIESLRKRIIRKIKEKQKKQKKEIENLRKRKKPDLIKKKMSQWKNQGYKMFETDAEIKKLTGKGINSN